MKSFYASPQNVASSSLKLSVKKFVGEPLGSLEKTILVVAKKNSWRVPTEFLVDLCVARSGGATQVQGHVPARPVRPSLPRPWKFVSPREFAMKLWRTPIPPSPDGLPSSDKRYSG